MVKPYVLLALILFLVILLYKEVFHPVVSFLLISSALVLLGIVNPKELLAGFSNEQIASIALLLVISSLVKKLGILETFIGMLIKDNLSYRTFLLRLTVSVSFLSAFLNNTPIVATLIPYVYEWGKKKGIAPSKLLIPLSYAAILGGTITLIGTSTNLLVNGLAVESGLPPLGMFDFSYVGIPATAAGVIYMITLGYKLLPSRKDAISEFLSQKREYLVETFVPEGSPIVGKTVSQAKLRNLEGLFLVEIIRRKNRIAPVSPEDRIEAGDILLFAGETEKVIELANGKRGLKLPPACSIELNGKVDVVEALVPINSSLIGKRVKDTDFRGKFDAAILAVHRSGEKLKGKIGEIILKPGDLLLILAGKDFWKRVSDSKDLYVITKLKELNKVESWKSFLFALGFISSIILSSLNIYPLFGSLFILITVSILLGLTSYAEVKKGFDFDIVLIAALSLAIGKAMVTTGLAEKGAELIVAIADKFGVIASLAAVYLIANLLTEFITNLAAASLTFPLAISVANSLSVNPKPFILAVAFGASASFLTPIGYQTNLMVYSLGNYKFKDFLKVGIPLSIIYGLVTISFLTLVYLRR